MTKPGYRLIFKPLPGLLSLWKHGRPPPRLHAKLTEPQGHTHVRIRQQLPHDVGIVDLPTSTKAIFLILKLFILSYLDFKKSSLLGMSSKKPALLEAMTCLG